LLSVVYPLSSITNIERKVMTIKKHFSRSVIVINAVVFFAKHTLFGGLLTHHHLNFSPRTLAVVMEIMAYARLGAPIYAGWAYDDI
jgi:hypothetical protein